MQRRAFIGLAAAAIVAPPPAAPGPKWLGWYMYDHRSGSWSLIRVSKERGKAVADVVSVLEPGLTTDAQRIALNQWAHDALRDLELKAA